MKNIKASSLCIIALAVLVFAGCAKQPGTPGEPDIIVPNDISPTPVPSLIVPSIVPIIQEVVPSAEPLFDRDGVAEPGSTPPPSGEKMGQENKAKEGSADQRQRREKPEIAQQLRLREKQSQESSYRGKTAHGERVGEFAYYPARVGSVVGVRYDVNGVAQRYARHHGSGTDGYRRHGVLSHIAARANNAPKITGVVISTTASRLRKVTKIKTTVIISAMERVSQVSDFTCRAL